MTNQWLGRDSLQVLRPPVVPGLGAQRTFIVSISLWRPSISACRTPASASLQVSGQAALLPSHPHTGAISSNLYVLGLHSFLGRLNLRYCLHVQDQEHRNCRDSPGGPLRLCVSKAVGVNLTLSQGTKIPHTTWPRKETTMTKKEDSHWKFKVRY